MLNHITLMGRLTADPELKTTTSGQSVTSFDLAVERNYKPQGGDRQTDFFKCVAWRGTAEFISRYFAKGRLMAIEGEMQSRSYENQEGRKITVWEVIVSNAYFCGDKSESSNNRNLDDQLDIQVDEPEDDDLPF